VKQDADNCSKQGIAPPQTKVDSDLQQYILTFLNVTPEKDKEEVRHKFQQKVIYSFLPITRDLDVQPRNYKLFLKYIRLLKTEGSGIQQKRKMIGRGYVSEEKYLKNKEKLLGGKLHIRSENENQVNNLKSQMITKKYKRYSLKNKC
jgi:hypothetical protein